MIIVPEIVEMDEDDGMDEALLERATKLIDEIVTSFMKLLFNYLWQDGWFLELATQEAAQNSEDAIWSRELSSK